MAYIKKYKVVNPDLKEINDIETKSSDSQRPAVDIIQNLNCTYNEYLDTSLAYPDSLANSLSEGGRLKYFIDNGHILEVYLDEEGNEIPASAVQKEQEVKEQMDIQVADFMNLLKDNNVNFQDLISAIGASKTLNKPVELSKTLPTKRKYTKKSDKNKQVNLEVVPPTTQVAIESTSNVLDNVIDSMKDDLLNEYKELKYQDRIQFLKELDDKYTLQEILKIETSSLLKSIALKQLSK